VSAGASALRDPSAAFVELADEAEKLVLGSLDVGGETGDLVADLREGGDFGIESGVRPRCQHGSHLVRNIIASTRCEGSCAALALDPFTPVVVDTVI
jgi:hypothetical protein